MPEVSVVIPTYNRVQFIERCVCSVLQQTYRDLEVIVVDDGSNDGTDIRLNNLKRNDSRLHFLRHDKNRGAQAARNTGIHAARGKYIAFLDSDNEWMPDKLERQLPLFENNNSQIGVVYSGFTWQYSDGRPSREQMACFRGNIYKIALRKWIADTSTLIVRKNVLYMCGRFDERIRSYQEWDFCIRLAKHVEFDFVNEPLVIYHVHEHPTISKNLRLDASGYLDVITTHREEILEVLGKHTFSTHLASAAHRFARVSDFATARELISQAVKLSPFHGRGTGIMFWILYRLGSLPNKIFTSFLKKTKSLC